MGERAGGMQRLFCWVCHFVFFLLSCLSPADCRAVPSSRPAGRRGQNCLRQAYGSAASTSRCACACILACMRARAPSRTLPRDGWRNCGQGKEPLFVVWGISYILRVFERKLGPTSKNRTGRKNKHAHTHDTCTQGGWCTRWQKLRMNSMPCICIVFALLQVRTSPTKR